jgi:formylglycine-generating enzyme required for sulfatase activity
MAFCQWLSAVSNRRISLPTEAQWEFAARGPDNRMYPWGNEPPNENRAHYGKDWNQDVTLPVGSKPAGRGPFGTLDQSGNVWEWCRDIWDMDAYKQRTKLIIDPVSPDWDILDPNIGRAARGGSFDNAPLYLRAAYRYGARAADRFDWRGFRVASI